MHNSATFKPSLRTWVSGLFVILFGLAPMASAAAAEIYGMPAARVEQSRGVDKSVDYTSLTKMGLWDDRNYQLSAADLKFLSPNEGEVSAQIPAFFRVELRKAWPHLQTKGSAQYPRAAWPMFKRKYGGIERNGKVWGPDFSANRVVPVNGELRISQIRNANEPTIEINKAMPQYAIAGSNNNGGQEMYYSHDGGETWTVQGVLPNTCCDPTVDWSSDGSIGYAAALSGPIGVSAWRTDDFGVTWTNRIDITPSGSDKEWVHVDKSDASPYQDNVYITYHNGNVMQFARSQDMGMTYDIQAFGSAPVGIGSDITTTANGDIYYVWASTGTSTVQMLKSTDGGTTFATPVNITSTSGNFDFPIPAMESRRAWIYAATDADNSGGPNDGSVYVAFTDIVGTESSTAANNHTQIEVWYSRDGGATWNVSIPHSTGDIGTIDRFNQWMTVDEQGNIHVVYYDTQHSANRTGVDLYYTISINGGVDWEPPTRVSGETSVNLTDGQEWGDYNGVSVVGGKVIPIWTDNRVSGGSGKDAFVADVTNVGAAPNFLLGADNSSFDVCVPDTVNVGLDVGSLLEFSEPVTLSTGFVPPGFVVNFTTNPVVPGNSSSAAITAGGSVAPGSYSINLIGSAAGVDDRVVGIDFKTTDAVPGLAGLTSPSDGAIDMGLSPTLSWSGATQGANYLVEVATDPGFANLIDTGGVTDGTNSYTVGVALDVLTTYYWRVRADNTCGDGVYSAANSFTTGELFCVTANTAITDDSTVSSTFASSNTGTLASLVVSVDAAHTWVGDVTLSLVHEATGTAVVLMDRPGVPATQFGCSANNIDADFDDDSAVVVETLCGSGPGIGGSVNPEGTLADFAGEDMGGIWRLDVSDGAGGDTGTLNEWCLLPTFEDTGIDSDGDGVDDSVDNCTLAANPGQQDTNGDGIGNRCDADVNNDCSVNFLDIAQFRDKFNTVVGDPAYDANFDLNSTGSINFQDFFFFRDSFNSEPGPSANACVPGLGT